MLTFFLPPVSIYYMTTATRFYVPRLAQRALTEDDHDVHSFFFPVNTGLRFICFRYMQWTWICQSSARATPSEHGPEFPSEEGKWSTTD